MIREQRRRGRGRRVTARHSSCTPRGRGGGQCARPRADASHRRRLRQRLAGVGAQRSIRTARSSRSVVASRLDGSLGESRFVACSSVAPSSTSLSSPQPSTRARGGPSICSMTLRGGWRRGTLPGLPSPRSRQLRLTTQFSRLGDRAQGTQIRVPSDCASAPGPGAPGHTPQRSNGAGARASGSRPSRTSASASAISRTVARSIDTSASVRIRRTAGRGWRRSHPRARATRGESTDGEHG